MDDLNDSRRKLSSSLPVGLTAVSYVKDEKPLIGPHVNDSILANSQTPKPLKLSPKRFPHLPAGTQLLFQSPEDSCTFLLIDPSEVLGNRGLVLDLIYQGAFSARCRR